MTDGENEIHYAYDASGQRISKTVNGVTTDFYYDDRGALILLSCEDGTGLYFYPEANGSIGSIGINGNRYYYVRNAQNDIIGITDKTGAFVARYTYDEWGVITSITDGNGVDVSANASHIANINPLRYRSYFYDTETGWYWLNTRYYNPEVGRFINADGQISGIGGDVLGYNMFTYCMNNPINMSDPSGNWPSWEDVCNGFKKGVDVIVQGLLFVTAPVYTLVSVETHYNRNILNDADYTEQELLDEKYVPLGADKDKFHQNNQINGKRNKKYVIGDWFSSEIVYYSDGTVNNTPEDMGTFNVYSGDNDFLNVVVHGWYDVIPYMIWGNSRDDSTTIIDRIVLAGS